MVTVPSAKTCIFREEVQIKDSLDKVAWLALHSVCFTRTKRAHRLQVCLHGYRTSLKWCEVGERNKSYHSQEKRVLPQSEIKPLSPVPIALIIELSMVFPFIIFHLQMLLG